MNKTISPAALERIAALLPQDAAQRHVPMPGLTTLRLGGPAQMVLEPENADQAALVLRAAHAEMIPVMALGRGSNLLVRDGGIPGIVLSTRRMNRLAIDGHTLTAGAGVPLSVLAKRAAEAGLAGLAFAGGIPGSVGGAVLMNAGAYNGEMSQVIARVSGLRMDGTAFTYTAEEMGFAHRTSRLQDEDCLITEAVFALTDGDPEQILAEIAELNRRRREKQPLELPSAGSTFKRPANGYASAMIDQCGLKGFRIGGAQVSEKHAGFCVNLGGTASDLLQLMDHVQKTVLDATGTLLEPEVRIVGVDTLEENA